MTKAKTEKEIDAEVLRLENVLIIINEIVELKKEAAKLNMQIAELQNE